MIKLHITKMSPWPSVEEPTVQQTPTNKQLTYTQTKFLMQNQLVEDDLPKSIQELNNCVYEETGIKNMQQEVANRLSEEFNEYFE